MNVAQFSQHRVGNATAGAERTSWRHSSRVLHKCRIAILVAGLLLAVGGCSQGPPSSDFGVWTVHFTLATSYEDALRQATDVGLRLSRACEYGTFIPTNGPSDVYWAPWLPASQRQDYQYYVGQAVSPFLVVQPRPLAPSDWSNRLLKMSGVQSVDGVNGPNAGCGLVLYSHTPPAGNVNDLLLPSQVGTYAQVTFDQSEAPPYGDALDDVLNLGLRLADPCYEKALADGKSPTWHAMGQEDAYAANHTLLVATTNETGNLWQQQVQAIPASVQVETNATAAC